MKKRYIIIVIVFCFALALPIVYSQKKVVWKEIEEVVTIHGEKNVMMKLDENNIRLRYHIASQDYQEYIAYASRSPYAVDEMLIFKVENDANRETIVQKLKEYTQVRTTELHDYGEELLAKLDNVLLVEKEQYVIYVVTSENEIKSQILECF